MDHRCARGEHCSERELIRDDAGEVTSRLGARITQAYGLCRRCLSFARQAIGHLTLDVAELTALMGRQASPGEVERVVQTPEARLPIRVGLEALRSDIDRTVRCWATALASELRLTSWNAGKAHRSRLGFRVKRGVEILARNMGALVELGPTLIPVWDDSLGYQTWRGGWRSSTQDGTEGALDLMRLHQIAYACAGRTKLIHHSIVPCPFCEQRELTQENGADDVRCWSDQCHGRKIDKKHWDWLIAVTMREKELEGVVVA